MNFRDELVKKGEGGGQEAAGLLRVAVMEHVRVQNPDLHNTEVLVRTYANLEGLSKAYVDSKILEAATEFASFVRGFNVSHAFCDYVDAGKGKECSDEKLRACLKHYLADIHCKYIVFGGSGDNGYARLLGPYSHDEAVRKRITMLEGPPFAQELAALKGRFAVASFPGIFRDSKLPTRRVSFSQSITPPSSPAPRVPTYATAVSQSKRPPSAMPSALAQGQDVSFNHGGRMQSRVLKNSKGERIDTFLRPNNNLVAIQKKQKLCNSYQLNGVCAYEAIGNNCNFSHARLTEAQLEAQRSIARQAPCGYGLACEEEKCLFGHHCPFPGCRGIDCKFPTEMHNVSRE